jgi:hypothetical protein
MTDWNCEPCCRSATRWLTGVCGLKNASQFLVIAAIVAADPPLAEVVGEGAAEVGGAELFGVLGLLLQAATVIVTATSAKAPRLHEMRR